MCEVDDVIRGRLTLMARAAGIPPAIMRTLMRVLQVSRAATMRVCLDTGIQMY